jgi:hypothetical protein
MSATVQNALSFRVSDPGFIGETEISSWEVLGEFSVGDSHGRFVVEKELSV